MNLLIPSLFFIAIISICYYLFKEYKKRKRLQMIKAFRDMESRFIIEKTVMRDLTYCEEYWNRNGSFNRQQYINYLESK